jgi:glutamate 5-kinase
VDERDKLRRARRVVIKIGSSTLASDAAVYARIAAAVVEARHEGRGVVIVSSGAIALGVRRLGWKTKPKQMAGLQAAAAAGQTALMILYEQAFRESGVAVAQVLLTHADLADRVRGNNARAALRALLDAGAVPILNENDSVSVEEIKFGDNDHLAALVTPLVDADLLVLLSDVDGLMGPDGARVATVRDIAREALPHVRASTSGAAKTMGTGGMKSKLDAARLGTLSGAHVVIADAREPHVLESILRGEDVGTLFVAAPHRLPAKKCWIAFTLRPRGAIVLDAGATRAVLGGGKSILPVGVMGVRGDFRAGDAVRILGAEGVEIGRGLARSSAPDAARVAGRAAADLATTDKPHAVLVHRNELVLWSGRGADDGRRAGPGGEPE